MSNEPKIIGGRYELGQTIGRGGMAQVSKARDLRLERDVAIKQLRLDLACDPTFQARFRREAHAAAGLNHPNIVAVYDTGEVTDQNSGVAIPYIVMELVEGQTLRDILRDGRKIIPRRALEFTQGVLDALSYSHKSGIVHRDIKPANVMLTNSGQIKVMDFGIARAVSETSGTMTQTAAIIGTAQYLSPEQARGETVDARSDIYSAGCLMYELLVGRPPFQGESPVSVAYQHVRENPTPPSEIDPIITKSMDAVVLKALAKDPRYRYQTAAAMRADIARLLEGQEVKITPAPVPVSEAKPVEAATAVMPAATMQMPPAVAPARATAVEPKKRFPWWWLLVPILVIILVGFYFYSTLPKAEDKVTVPAVFGKTQAEATSIIEKANLAPKVEEVAGPSDDSVGKVIKQDPAPQTEVAKGTTIKISINVGSKKITVPNGLTGQDKNAVDGILRNAGFTNITAEIDKDSLKPLKENVVTRLNVEPGSEQKIDTKIIIYYSNGEIKVPNLIGLSKDDALAAAAEAGLGQVRIEPQVSNSPKDSVISQDPKAATKAKFGTPITIEISAGANEEDPIDTPSATPSSGGRNGR